MSYRQRKDSGTVLDVLVIELLLIRRVDPHELWEVGYGCVDACQTLQACVAL